MYHNSTQKKHWTFKSEEELQRLRVQANNRPRAKILAAGKTHLLDIFNVDPHEELIICRYYEKKLRDFCSTFKPTMPKSVMGTACMYFKRFFLNNSVMEHYPRIIMWTCVFLACKVDEFNVSSVHFVCNLPDHPTTHENILDQILEYELLLIQQLNFHLIVHNPYRPFEGYLIDLKTRYPLLDNPEILRKNADEFLHRVVLTDACLLFTPSIIALTAILSSASRAGINMESYLLECLSLKEDPETMAHLLDGMRRLQLLMSKHEYSRLDDVDIVEKKLEKCYNAEGGFVENLEKRKGYEDDDYISKKPKTEEEWSDDDLVDTL
ncbi:cyclin-H isoform 2-T2 [Leptodactylus fuscus]|uniref:cyclin-H isoform X2 n=1 Tax=Leptodactylus fuscus TaxID=238119 RepID=UPI003F4F222E